jgi:protein-tyrosine phosphatase
LGGAAKEFCRYGDSGLVRLPREHLPIALGRGGAEGRGGTAWGSRSPWISAGTGDWHIGRAPDHRAIAVARKNGTNISHLRARQVTRDDFHRFDHIVALDAQNLADLRDLQPVGGTAKLSLLLDHVEGRGGHAVADPYYGDADHFDTAWADVTQGAKGLMRAIAAGA